MTEAGNKSQVINTEQSSDNEAQLVTREYIKRSSPPIDSA
jgi:hypothetical protein